MKNLNRFTCISILIAWLLAACSQSGVQVTNQASPPATASPAATFTARAAGSQAGCTVVSRQPTPNPTEEALIPPPGEGDWVKGSEEAPITLLEYSDFQ